ncbi:MAG: hypothetical protein AAGJ18_21185 [Bacteroidota bacterium]
MNTSIKYTKFCPVALILAVLLASSCQVSTPLIMTNLFEEQPESVIMPTVNGEEVKVKKVSGGTLGLYCKMVPVLARDRDIHDPFLTDEPDSLAQFYLGYELVERVGEYNFERIIKKSMSDAPLILENLGKRGFRYENLPSMVYYYNNFYGDGKSLEVLTARGD